MSRKKAVSSETADSVFATKLSELLKKRSMNQSQLGKATNLQRQTISNYANGQSVPDANTLIKISNALYVSVDYLLDISDIETPDSTIQGAVQCTGLDEDAINKIADLSESQKEILSDIISSPKFNDFLNAFAAAIAMSGDVSQLMDCFESGIDESATKDDIETSLSIFDDTIFMDRELQGFKYSVIDSSVKLLNDIQPYDEIVEQVRILHSNFDISKLENRLYELHKKEVEQNGLDKA